MKTSNIIFISLLSINALFIAAEMINIRENSTPSGINLMNKLPVPPFKVLILNNNIVNGMKIDVIQNDSSFIKITWNKDSLSPQLNYTIKEDTLIVSDLNVFPTVELNFTNSLKKMILTKSTINLKRLNLEELSLDLNDSKVFSGTDKSVLNVLEISAMNYSRLYLNKFKLDSMKIELQNSEANLYIIAKIIHGELSDNSRLNSWQQGEIYLKKDSTSKFSVR